METIPLFEHPYLRSMYAIYRRIIHLSAPLPPGLNPYAQDGVVIQLALAHGEMRTIKEVVARTIIENKIQSGELRPGMTAIDATSGNTGRAYAGILQPLGIRLKLVVKSSLPPGKLTQLYMYGEGVEIISHSGPESTVARARREAKEFGYVSLDQYADKGNPEAHEMYTAPELCRLTNGEIAAIVVALGTCGTAIGLSRYFKRLDSNIRIIGVAVNPETAGGRVPQIPGMRTPAEIDRDVRFEERRKAIDLVRVAYREQAVRGSRMLAYAEPSWPGLSTGAAYCEALSYIGDDLKWLRGKRVIIISPDSIEPYMDIMQAEQDDADIEKALTNRPAF